jgi:Family of unknown function (DUF6455)
LRQINAQIPPGETLTMRGFRKEGMMGIFGRITQRMDRQTHLMGAMMERLGVDIEAAGMQAGGGSLANAARACVVCRSSDECKRWLEADGDAGEPNFCPSRRFFTLHHREATPD